MKIQQEIEHDEKDDEKLVSLFDFERKAKEILPPMVRGYYFSGACDEITLRENVTAFQRIFLRPRVLRGLSASGPDLRCRLSVGGERFSASFPVFVAPTAMQRLASGGGELDSVRAAVRAGTAFCLSSWSTTAVEVVAEAAFAEQRRVGSPDRPLLIMQLYVYRDREMSFELARRARRCGFAAVVLTVDTPVLGIREADCRAQFALPPPLRLANFAEDCVQPTAEHPSFLAALVAQQQDPTLDISVIPALGRACGLPVWVKGVLRADDATRAVAAGAEALLVSNHGARQCDGTVAAIDALPAVVKAARSAGKRLGKHVPVMLDGGVRRGTDALKALALGASAVFVGRPVLCGLAVNGQDGAEEVLQILKREFSVAMSICGCQNLQDITADLLSRRPGALSKV